MRLARWVCAVSLFTFLPCAAFSQQHTLPLWPNGNPEPSTITGPETDPTTDSNRIVSGKVTVRITNVSKPTLSVYFPPKEKNTGAAALVFPGGAYIRLAWNLEGTEVCDWLNSIGMTCLLVKYRVPETGHYPDNVEDLEDAQQAMRIARAHAVEWAIDPQRIGAIGFSAGAHLAAALSTHSDFQGKNVPPSTADAKPNWQMLLYPGWLNGADGKVNPTVKPVADTPPTFLVMAEDDYTAHVENALVYFQALKDVKVPAELHLFTQGGHGFGLRPTALPISRWPTLAEAWLHTIHILGTPGPVPRP
ncbi:alpha/beta hydrolase [Terriglobus sp. ADX1]|uniref:alpha/beta hydrolase n=1 Tax=Terriglobus sp. ADX1 TaxID=2794063 RepID=UPI002FE5FE20